MSTTFGEAFPAKGVARAEVPATIPRKRRQPGVFDGVTKRRRKKQAGKTSKRTR